MAEQSGNSFFAFQDGKVYAFLDGQIVASEKEEDVDKLEHLFEKKDDDEGTKEKDEKKDEKEDSEDSDDSSEDSEDDDSKESSIKTHIVTPNGLKGQILGKTKGLWGEEVTVRLENGRIAHLTVSESTRFVSDEVERPDLIKSFKDTIYASYSHDIDSLVERREALTHLKSSMRSAALNDTAPIDQLDELRVLAETEINEIDTALEAADDLESFIPEAPFESHVYEQESMGGHSSSWIDKVAQDMIDEAEGQDFEKLMDEGPDVFIAGLDSAIVGDTGATREAAQDFIRERTAGIQFSMRDEYERLWLDRIEQVRQASVTSRKKSAQKQASSKPKDEHADLPDDILFS